MESSKQTSDIGLIWFHFNFPTLSQILDLTKEDRIPLWFFLTLYLLI